MTPLLDIIIVGAGPTGLACAVEAARRGLRHVVLEKGAVANTIIGYPTRMTFFSTVDKLSIGGIPFTSPDARPSRDEAIAYYQGVAASEKLDIRLGQRVESVERSDNDLFTVRTDREELTARTVVLATGYFDNTNRLDIPGEDLPHVHHYYKEPYSFFGRRVVVIGGRNSAVETALDLWRHNAAVTMIHRGAELGKSVKYWIRPDIENRITDGEIAVRWRTEAVAIGDGWIDVRNIDDGIVERLDADAIIAQIGYRPDEELFRRCGIAYDPETLVPRYDPRTFETNVDGLFLAGSIACGCKTWEIFIENGREHAVTVVNEIAARMGIGG